MQELLHFERDGFAMTPSLFSAGELQALISLVEQHAQPEQGRGGVRDVMQHVPELRAVAESPQVRYYVNAILGEHAFVVRATFFDKTEGANWKVPWHQDVTIAVRERREVEGYSVWSIKQGVEHVQPPSRVLEAMLTVRVHLDPCPATNGALRVMPGTHRLGKINQNTAEQHVIEAEAITCTAAAGEALLMRPLLLHASAAATQPAHRRVLHFDYAAADLDDGLEWKLR